MMENLCSTCSQYLICPNSYSNKCCFCPQSDSPPIKDEEIEELTEDNWECEHGYSVEAISNKENQSEELDIDFNAEKISCNRCGWRRTTKQPINTPAFWGLNLFFDYLCEDCLDYFSIHMDDKKKRMLEKYKEIKRQEQI